MEIANFAWSCLHPMNCSLVSRRLVPPPLLHGLRRNRFSMIRQIHQNLAESVARISRGRLRVLCEGR